MMNPPAEVSNSSTETNAEENPRVSMASQERESIYINLPLIPISSPENESIDLNLPLLPSSPQERESIDLNLPSTLNPVEVIDQKIIEVIDLDSDGFEEGLAGPSDPMLLDEERGLWELALASDLISSGMDLDENLVIKDDWLSVGIPRFELDEEEQGKEEQRERVKENENLREYRRNGWRYHVIEEIGQAERLERRRKENRARAIEYAPTFAVYKGNQEEKEKEEVEVYPLYGELDDISVTFSDAMKVIEKREGKIYWNPSRNQELWPSECLVPSLKDLCLRVLVENAEEIESLEGIPDVLKDTLVSVLCSKRKMTKHVLGLYLIGSLMEVHLSDGSWAAEVEFKEILARLNCDQLMALQLDLCGRCMTDSVLRATLAKSPSSLPLLTTISLKGAYCLSDDGLDALVTSAPLLSSVNLRQCNLLTSDGIISLAVKLNSVLRELYLDDCQNVDAMLILPALKKLKFLEALSVARVQNVCDKFVYNLVRVCGPKLKELVFADCRKLTVASMRAIGENCPQLCALDIRNLDQLNEFAIRHLANGCRSIQKLKLRRNMFSDEATAAFLEASGGSLTELSLNNVVKVAEHTALAISLRCSQSLCSLDLSFCRKITDGALGLIVDSCSNLRILRLFGCTQITDFFLNGHSNSHVKIIGLKGQL